MSLSFDIVDLRYVFRFFSTLFALSVSTDMIGSVQAILRRMFMFGNTSLSQA